MVIGTFHDLAIVVLKIKRQALQLGTTTNLLSFADPRPSPSPGCCKTPLQRPCALRPCPSRCALPHFLQRLLLHSLPLSPQLPLAYKDTAAAQSPCTARAPPTSHPVNILSSLAWPSLLKRIVVCSDHLKARNSGGSSQLDRGTFCRRAEPAAAPALRAAFGRREVAPRPAS